MEHRRALTKHLSIALVCATALMLFGVAAKAGVGMSFFWIGAPGGGAPAAAPTCLLNFSTYVCAGGLN